MNTNDRDSLRTLAELKKVVQKDRETKYRDDSKLRLKKIAGKKIQTSFIGAISKFEEHFGFLWGHNQQEQDLTPEQKELREQWVNCRNEILNNGNNQKRALEQEIEMYTLSWDRYQMSMKVAPLNKVERQD